MMKACVMGWPIAHSLSPALHGYWLKAHGIAGEYTRQAVRPEELPAALTRLKSDDWRGCNLTIPHKQAALAVMDRVDPFARSEERRVGKECRSVCRSRWSPYH